MGIAERRAREKELLRAKILDAAGELFISEGFANVSLRKIADKIEYSPATIYLYFRDKNQLLSSLCQETFANLLEELLRLEREERDPLLSLRKGLRFYIDFGMEHPHHYMLTFATPPTQYQEIQKTPEFEETNRSGLETFDCLRRSLERCRQAGILAFDDLEATSQVVWMQIHGMTSLLITYHGDPHFPWLPKEKLIETGLDMLIRSLRALPVLSNATLTAGRN
jgi:AcrR family transcriptional regulator